MSVTFEEVERAWDAGSGRVQFYSVGEKCGHCGAAGDTVFCRDGYLCDQCRKRAVAARDGEESILAGMIESYGLCRMHMKPLNAQYEPGRPWSFWYCGICG